MRLLVVAESPPTTDAVHGNGSTMITANVLPLMSSDIDIDLAYFPDRPACPDADVLDRVRSVTVLPMRPGWHGWMAQLTTRLPRATALRRPPACDVEQLWRNADAVYLHGLHTAALGRSIRKPTMIHVVDPWSQFWFERARGKNPAEAAYFRDQARRADRLEREIAGWARTTFVVNPKDAATLSARTGGRVVAVPNGVAVGASAEITADPDRVSFVGTLDYAPNVEALERLIHRVWPLVRAERPTARLTIAGRRPGDWLQQLSVPGVEVLGAVDDVGGVFASSAAAAYIGVTGRGTKNTISEAIAAGCPVVASPEAARGQAVNEHLHVATTDEAIAGSLVALLVPGARRPEPVVARPWSVAAAEYEAEIRSSASP